MSLHQISLQPQTLASYDAFCRGLVQDPMLFADPEAFVPYVYNADAVAAAFARNQQRADRQYYMIFLGDRPIGELVLKNIDLAARSCALGICLQNNSVKNQGYGTAAERLALKIAFDTLKLDTVYADALIRNERSCHVLEKIGFERIREDGRFRYYRMTKEQFAARAGEEPV